MNNDLFDPVLDPDAERLAYKLQAFLKSKAGNLLDLVTLKTKKSTYYWCILSKSFVLVHGNAEFYILPWKKDDKNQVYLYCHHLFAQGAVILVPEEEIVYLGFN